MTARGWADPQEPREERVAAGLDREATGAGVCEESAAGPRTSPDPVCRLASLPCPTVDARRVCRASGLAMHLQVYAASNPHARDRWRGRRRRRFSARLTGRRAAAPRLKAATEDAPHHVGEHALLEELLRAALQDAGVVRSIAPLQPRRQALAVAWLTGALDAEVALSVAVVCDALGIDAGALAAAMRARASAS